MTATTPTPQKYLNRHRLSLATGIPFAQIEAAIVRGALRPDGLVNGQPLFEAAKLEVIRQALARPAVEFVA